MDTLIGRALEAEAGDFFAMLGDRSEGAGEPEIEDLGLALNFGGFGLGGKGLTVIDLSSYLSSSLISCFRDKGSGDEGINVDLVVSGFRNLLGRRCSVGG